MRTIGCILFALFALLAGMSAAGAATFTILPDGGGDFPTIQAGIDAIDDGDVLELGAGTFTGDGNRDIDFLGKAIVVRSQTGSPETCILDCQGSVAEPHRGFHFRSGEGTGSVLDGVTITGGWAGDGARGAGIRCENASGPIISNCVLSQNRGAAALCIDHGHLQCQDCVFEHNAALEGGGVCCEEATLTLTGCRFLQNTADMLGGAVHAHAATIEIVDCEFDQNSAAHGGATDFHFGCTVELRRCRYYGNSAGEAGAVCLFGMCTGLVADCTFADNTAASWGGALSVGKSSICQVRGCTFYGNAAPSGAVLLSDNQFVMANTVIAFNLQGPGLYEHSNVLLSCCDIFGNEGGDWIGAYAGQYGTNGNIAADPLFCAPEVWDFTLHADSPCAPNSPPNPECDRIGAWPVGCGPTPTRETSWGRLKALYRQ